VGLKDLDCQSVDEFSEPLDSMQAAAKTLCLGLTGDQAAWEKGVSALDTMPPPPAGDCWSEKAYELLRNVAAFRREKPDVPFKLAVLPGTACPPELRGLSDRKGDPSDSVCPGDMILLVGPLGGLPANSISEVKLGTTTAKVQHRESPPGDNYPLGDFYFKAPSVPDKPPVPGKQTTVDVTISMAKLSVKGSASFAYAADQTTCLQKAPGNIP
jgi:hypothetical protein